VKQPIGIFTLLLSCFMSSHTAHGATRGHVLAGGNGTQVTVDGNGEKSISNGYASYALGTGFSYFPISNLAFELDVFFTNRKFGFDATKASFSTFQIPFTTQYHFWQFHVGGGAYTALWSFDGVMESDGQTKTVSVADAGQTSSEVGIALLAGLTQRVYGLPLRLEARYFQSVTDIAKSSSFKGSLTEWQILLGYEIDTDSLLEKWFGIAPKKAVPKGSKSQNSTKSATPSAKDTPKITPPTGGTP
jgi:hypothetical protein